MSRNFLYICLYVTLLQLPLTMCLNKTDLVFVIDRTSSMGPEIKQITETINSITASMTSSKSSEIQDIVVVTFNDPEIDLLIKSRSQPEIKAKLESVIASGGLDCPEPSLAGIKLGLEKSLKGSYVFVFTDDIAKDVNLYNEVKRLAQEKQSQVVFIITPSGLEKCQEGKNFTLYYEIAKATSGQVFNLTVKEEIEKVLHYVEEIVKGPKTIITEKVFPANVSSPVKFEVDEKINNAIISVSGRNVTLKIISGPTTQYDQVVWIANVKIVRVTGAGNYVAEVNGLDDTSVLVYGRTDFTFQYGFSDHVPSVFDGSVEQPTSNVKTHLLISIEDPKKSCHLETVQIWNMDEHVIQELPLRQISGDYYITEEFLPPTVTFKIAIKGKYSDGKSFIRACKTPIEPKSKSEIPQKTTITEKVKEHHFFSVECEIDGQDKTAAYSWEFKGNIVSKSAVLNISDVTPRHSGIYTCTAEDKLGRSTQILELEVEEEQPAVNKSQETINSGWNSSSRPATKQGCENINSENYHYLMTILPELEKIPPKNKLRLRNKINQAIFDELNVVCF